LRDDALAEHEVANVRRVERAAEDGERTAGRHCDEFTLSLTPDPSHARARGVKVSLTACERPSAGRCEAVGLGCGVEKEAD
jgi:hypothetical protein